MAHWITVQKRNLISIPKEIRKILNIKEGDILNVRVQDDKIILEPYKLIPSNQAYFWAESTQKDLQESRADVKNGRVREFKNIEEFLSGLEE